MHTHTHAHTQVMQNGLHKHHKGRVWTVFSAVGRARSGWRVVMVRVMVVVEGGDGEEDDSGLG